MAVKDRVKFEEEMKKRHIQENLEQIKKRQQIGGQAYREQKNKRRKEEAEKLFEAEVIKSNV